MSSIKLVEDSKQQGEIQIFPSQCQKYLRKHTPRKFPLEEQFKRKIWHVHPWRLTWNIIMEVWKIIFLSKRVICRFHVNVPGCISSQIATSTNQFNAATQRLFYRSPTHLSSWIIGAKMLTLPVFQDISCHIWERILFKRFSLQWP